MVQVRIKRVYEDFSERDGYRVLVDKLWPRGIKKEWLKYDYWAKDITPSAALRKWFHEDIPGHWNDFVVMYQKELEASQAVADFLTLNLIRWSHCCMRLKNLSIIMPGYFGIIWKCI